MRPAVVCFLLLLPCMQAASAGPPSQTAAPIVPVLTLTIDPPLQNLNSSEESSVNAQFDGTASVDKLPITRCVVTLTSSTDIGWVSQVSPSTMVFTSTTPQSFTVVVTVPQGTASMQGKLTVNGRAVSAGLQSMAEATAIVDVKGPARLNLTAQNRTQGNATRAAETFGGGLSGTLTVSVLVLVLVAVPTVTYLVYRRRRRRAFLVEA